MKKLELLLVALVLLVSSISVVSAEDWPMFHHDLALSGVTGASAPDNNNTLWTYNTFSSISSSPAIVNEKLYIGADDGNLYSIDAKSGTLLWTYITKSRIVSSPAVDNGIVYFLAENGNISALNADTGLLLWENFLGNGPWDWSSPAVHNGNVFIGSSTGYVYSLNGATGIQNWKSLVNGTPNSHITVVNGKVYSGTHNFDKSSPTLVALDESTGAILWTYDSRATDPDTRVTGMINHNGVSVADGDGDGSLEVYFGVVTWGYSGNEAISLDEATGNEEWNVSLGGWSTSTPAVHNGKVFIGSDDGNLYALDASKGSILWHYQTKGPVWSAPAVSGDGKVVFGSWDHTYYAVSELDGSLIWSYYTGASRVLGSPAIADVDCNGIVFAGNENGNIYAFGSLSSTCALDVSIDIKPGSFPNSINLGSEGSIPIAIFSTATFDATTVDPLTVTLASAPVRLKGKGTPMSSKEDKNGDGLLDLVVHVSTQALQLSAGDSEAVLEGQTYDGRRITGKDSVRIVPP